jgi:hypothetical protein
MLPGEETISALTDCAASAQTMAISAGLNAARVARYAVIAKAWLLCGEQGVGQ